MSKKLKKYYATFTVDATTSVEVFASSKEEAEEKAWNEIGRPSICHQCSREMDIGDIMDLVECEELS